MPTAELARGAQLSGHLVPAARYAVLCSPQDPSGPWAKRVLDRYGLAGVRLVTVEEIVYSTRIVHRQSGGVVTTEVTLPDGAVLGPGLRSVLNRVVTVPADHLARAGDDDRRYALQEVYALLTSVLASLPGVVNAAGSRGLPGPYLREAEWLCEAARAGLAGVGLRSGQPPADRARPDRQVVVIGDDVVAAGDHVAVPEQVRDGCLALSRRVRAEVLGIDFVSAPSGWLFAGAGPTPDLRQYGDRGAVALCRLMTAGEDP